MQYVIISFDGAQHVAQWQRSRKLAARTGARFTYFLSCVYLLTNENRSAYTAPGKSAGRSNVGFGGSKDEVENRLRQIWLAHLEGQDIASHGCGHFDGKDWSTAQWTAEFDAFSSIVRDAYVINGISYEPPGWRRFVNTSITGFRAPYLSAAKSLYAALAKSGFTYDASGVSKGPIMPARNADVARFALPQIPEGPSARPVIAMDYNLFVRHSGGFERADKGGAFEERTLAAFKQAFENQYSGDRTPLQLGFHFTLMNDGAYWRALERFAEEVCVKADVACVSYRDYLDRTSPTASAPSTDVGG